MFDLHNFSALCFGVPELLFQGGKDVFFCKRAYISRLIHGISHLQFPEACEEVFTEFRSYFFMDDETFCSYTALTGVDHAGIDSRPARLFNVSIVKYNERIGAAKLQYYFLDLTSGTGADFLPCLVAPCERYRIDLITLDEIKGVFRGDEEGLENMIRESCLFERVFDGKGRHGYVGGVFQHHNVPGAYRRDAEPEGLPEREVPWHDCEHDPQRVESYI